MEPNSSRLYTVGRDTNSSNSSAYYASRPEVTAGRKLIKTTGSLEIIEGTDSGMCGSFDSSVDSRPSSSASPRPWSRGSVGAVPPRADSSMGRRVYTPTKQIALQAVRRKEESSEPFVDHIDWKSTSLDTSHRKAWDLAEEGGQGDAARTPAHHIRQDFDIEPSQHATKLRLPIPDQRDEQQMVEKRQRNDGVRTVHKVEMNGEEKQRDNDDNKEEKDDEDDDDDDDESDSSDDEEDERKAPNELLMEFVDCLMKKDFPTASKLCKMILLYEPENAEALKFQPLIEEKLALDAEAAKEAEEEGSDDEDDDEDDSDDDDDDDDSDDDDDDTSSDEESSDNDNDDISAGGDNNSQNAPNNGRNVEPGHHPPHFHRADSGIASDTEHGN